MLKSAKARRIARSHSAAGSRTSLMKLRRRSTRCSPRVTPKTYDEVAEELGFPKSTVYAYATVYGDYRCLERKVRPACSKKSHLRVKLQIDSAGGHGTAVGRGNFDKLKAMMLMEYNIELVKQPHADIQHSRPYDLAVQLEVDKMNREARQREDGSSRRTRPPGRRCQQRNG